ncbi:MAG TPA: electron transport complex subunit RsxB [Burkholderiales bacterium]|nr:electron transport complex subunit RsxB [Burkholderiales bacterium]
MADLVEQIDRLLPQTQCGKCGFGGCRPYAEAIAGNEAPINRCPPGGATGIARLAELLAREPLPLDTSCGGETRRSVALIDESRCIGCTLCIQACPADAIVGASKHMHTVLIAQCTGCELCLPPCPVDCISMAPMSVIAEHSNVAREEANVPVSAHADRWRERYHRRIQRLARQRDERDQRLLVKAQDKLSMIDSTTESDEAAKKRAAIRAAIERARARLAASGSSQNKSG